MVALTVSREGMKKEFCQILMKIGVLKFGIFTLTSGKTSPYYIDLRIVPSFPEAFRRVCDLYLMIITEDLGVTNFERIAGIPTAGIPFAALIAYHLKKPFIYIRPRARLHGRERRVEGIIMPGDRVLLIDDLVTTGRSLSNFAKAVIAEGGVVTDVVVLLDREEGGKERLAKENITLHYLLKVGEAAEKLYEIGAINEEQLKTVLRQVKTKQTR